MAAITEHKEEVKAAVVDKVSDEIVDLRKHALEKLNQVFEKAINSDDPVLIRLALETAQTLGRVDGCLNLKDGEQAVAPAGDVNLNFGPMELSNIRAGLRSPAPRPRQIEAEPAVQLNGVSHRSNGRC